MKSFPVSLRWLLVMLLLFWGYLFVMETVTFAGVPASIIAKFLQDTPAISAFLIGDSSKLHDRLQQLNIEKAIKAYYRPKITDEIELDRYIHQLFYDRTGYVGDKYRLTPEGKLVLTDSGWERLQQELATQ